MKGREDKKQKWNSKKGEYDAAVNGSAKDALKKEMESMKTAYDDEVKKNTAELAKKTTEEGKLKTWKDGEETRKKDQLKARDDDFAAKKKAFTDLRTSQELKRKALDAANKGAAENKDNAKRQGLAFTLEAARTAYNKVNDEMKAAKNKFDSLKSQADKEAKSSRDATAATAQKERDGRKATLASKEAEYNTKKAAWDKLQADIAAKTKEVAGLGAGQAKTDAESALSKMNGEKTAV